MKRPTATLTTTATGAKSSDTERPNTFHAPLVFDDEGSIIENPVIKNLASFLFDGAGYRYNPRRFIGYLKGT